MYPPALRARPTDAMSRRPGHVLFAVHGDQLEEVRHGERSYEQTEYPEVGNAQQRSDERDQGVDLGPPSGHHGSDDVIDVADHKEAPQREHHRRAGPMVEEQPDRCWPPYEATPEHGKDREDHRDHTP